MIQHLVLSILCNDRPGIVKELAGLVSDHGGNWLESQLVQMAGKFAGVVRIAIPEESEDTLRKSLQMLSQRDIQIVIEKSGGHQQNSPSYLAAFSLAGPDRPGIVLEVSQAFAEYQINVETFTTQCSSMPYSGDPLFEAQGTLSVPEKTDWIVLHEQILNIADHLGIDIQLHKQGDNE